MLKWTAGNFQLKEISSSFPYLLLRKNRIHRNFVYVSQLIQWQLISSISIIAARPVRVQGLMHIPLSANGFPFWCHLLSLFMSHGCLQRRIMFWEWVIPSEIFEIAIVFNFVFLIAIRWTSPDSLFSSLSPSLSLILCSYRPGFGQASPARVHEALCWTLTPPLCSTFSW